MDKENTFFQINCIMEKRWIPHFLAMLNYMEYLGDIGSSRQVGLYADGDGDFRPKFEWVGENITNIKKEDLPEPVAENNGNRLYDAG
jgi:hypothetical protein